MTHGSERGKWYGAWCAYLTALLEERRLNPTDFATLVGDQQNNVWRYQRGFVKAPLKKLETWATRLRLDEAERSKFIRLGRLSHASKEIRDEIELLRQDNAALRAQLGATRDLLEQQGVDTSSLDHEVV